MESLGSTGGNGGVVSPTFDWTCQTLSRSSNLNCPPSEGRCSLEKSAQEELVSYC